MNFDKKLIALSKEADAELAPVFSRIDEISTIIPKEFFARFPSIAFQIHFLSLQADTDTMTEEETHLTRSGQTFSVARTLWSDTI